MLLFHVKYGEEFLNNKQINEIDNYLLVLTKNWSLTFEVYYTDDNWMFQIAGETPIYDLFIYFRF